MLPEAWQDAREDTADETGLAPRHAGTLRDEDLTDRRFCTYNSVIEEALMRFTWDPEKARRNLAKHGVAFEDAALVWHDRCC
jgi:hypothetical protein